MPSDSDNSSHFATNRAWWDAVVPMHEASRGYNREGFLRGEKSLCPVELAELGPHVLLRPAGQGTEVLPPLPGDSATGGGGRGGAITVPLELRVRPLLRFETQDKLLVSGLLDGGADIASQSVVVDVPTEKGHYVLFANNPIYRGETIGSYFMVFNAILNFDNLAAGRTDAAAPGDGGRGRGGRGGAEPRR